MYKLMYFKTKKFKVNMYLILSNCASGRHFVFKLLLVSRGILTVELGVLVSAECGVPGVFVR